MNFATDELLKNLGLKYEDLNFVERDTYNKMLTQLAKSEISLTSWKDNITQMKVQVELEMYTISEDDLDDKKVKSKLKSLLARLKNYILLESYLLSSERAKATLKAQITNSKPKI
jgi:hypothetical protein